MHPVLEHIFARKGKSVPVDDGRKIALVLFGGIMCGIRGTGATIALHELGVDRAFDEIYTYSAGFCNASYMLANQAKVSSSVYYDDLSGRRFINFWRFWNIADIDHLIHVFQHGPKALKVDKVQRSNTVLYAALRNTQTGKIEYVDVKTFSHEEYFAVLRASITMPLITRGTNRIHRKQYGDIGMVSNIRSRFLKKIYSTDVTDVVVVYNYPKQADGISHLYTKSRIFQIIPNQNNYLSRFETNTDKLKSAAQEMGDWVKQIFGSNEPIDLGE